jgi:hypothetical protein
MPAHDPTTPGAMATLCVWNLTVTCVPSSPAVGSKPAMEGAFAAVQSCDNPHWSHWIELLAYREDPANPGTWKWTRMQTYKYPGTPTGGGNTGALAWTPENKTLADMGFVQGEVMKIKYHIRCSGCTAREYATKNVLIS